MATPALIVAGLSARAMAASARRGGMQVVALDAFGDADTRRNALHWAPIARPGQMRIDASLAHAALRAFGATPGLLGWVPGAGFERWPAGLAAHEHQPLLLGNSPATWRATRDPVVFFNTLDRLNIAHPPVQHRPPVAPSHWLRKDMSSSGGWHVRAARRTDPPRPGRYWQALAPGKVMGALFIANGHEARTIGVHCMLTAPHSARPDLPACGFAGMIGPLPLALAVQSRIDDVIEKLVSAFGLAGLCSLDFMLDETSGALQVLEINPRPTASLSLYDAAFENGLMQAHVAACRVGSLPAVPVAQEILGEQIVFAPETFVVDEHLAAAFSVAEVHDQPRVGSVFRNGDPICTVSASGSSTHDVLQALAFAVQETTHTIHQSISAHSGALT
jgi:predicted ATP-grasp superfamily ATP-dependent carboligase